MTNLKIVRGEIAACTAANDHWYAAALLTEHYGTNEEHLLLTQYSSDTRAAGKTSEAMQTARRGIVNACLDRLDPVTADILRGSL